MVRRARGASGRETAISTILNQGLPRAAWAVLLAAILAGCVTSPPPSPPPTLVSTFQTAPSPYPGADARFEAAGADPTRDGLVHFYRQDLHASRVWTSAVSVDGVRIAAFIHGALTLPMARGDYAVAIRYGVLCGSFFARADCTTNPFHEAGQEATFKVLPGQELFVEIRAINPAPGFIFVEDEAGGFLADGHQPVEAMVARIDPPAPTEAELRARFAQSTLKPAAVRRDTLIVQIGDLVKAGDLPATLPLFERLNALPVPIDPMVDFYWGWALIDSGEANAGVTKLTRFAERTDTASPYYRQALRLIARAGKS